MRYIARYKNEEGVTVWDLNIYGDSIREIEDTLLNKGIFADFVIPFPFSLTKYKRNGGLSDKQCKDLFFQLANLVRSSGNIFTVVNILYNKINAINQDKFVHRSKIRQALKKIIRYYYNDKFKHLITFLDDLRNRISAGDNLVNVFSEYKFDEVVVSLLKSGEKTGDLYAGFSKCMQYYESKQGYKKAIISAFSYPALLFILLYAAFLVFLFFVIPQFAMFFKQFHDISQSTKNVINLFAFLKEYYFYYTSLFVALGAVLFYFFILNKYNIRTKIFNGLATIPIVGELFQFEFLRYFMYQFALFISSGVDIMGIIKFFKDNTKNDFYKTKLEIIHLHLLSGYSLTKSFEIAAFLRPEDIYFIDAAEKSGTLDEAAMELSKTYSEYFDIEMKLFKNVLSTLAIVMVVVFILIIFTSVYLPLIHGMISIAR